MTKNCQKSGSLNCDLLKFLYWYGVFWVPPGESSCPGGVEGVKGRFTGSRSLPYFQKKSVFAVLEKNRYGNNFQNIVSKTNQHWVINYDKPPIHFGTDILKIVAISVFF